MISRVLRAAPAVLAGLTLTTAVALPARADDTVTCPQTPLIHATRGWDLFEYILVGADTPAPRWGGPTIGSRGMNEVGDKLLAGPNYWMYTFDSRGVVRTRHITPSTPPRVITTSWKDYGGPNYRNKITVDQLGDFYLIDAKGKLRWSRFNHGQLKWDSYNVAVASGWDRFDLIVAAGAGVLYGRQPDGKLFRFRIDPATQQWVEPERQVGTGWQSFKSIISVGGDILLGLKADGSLHHFRFRADNGTWPVGGTRIGVGWGTFDNVVAKPDGCRLA